MRFFADNCVPKPIVEALKALRAPVEHLTDSLPANTPDVAWMPVVAERKLTVVTSDHRIRTRPSERLLRSQLQLCTVFLPAALSQKRLWDQAAWLVKHWPELAERGAELRDGACLLVDMKGHWEPLRSR